MYELRITTCDCTVLLSLTFILTNGGIHWDRSGRKILDARPETLRRECEASLSRLNTDRVDLLYLHAPDPKVPIAESAGELKSLLEQGKTRAVGASNLSLDQLTAFREVCPLAAFQPHYNMLQREIEQDTLPWCQRHEVSVMVYWPLLKGLLAGKLARDHVFQPGDGRAKYAMFQGTEWHKNQDLVDRLREISHAANKTVAQLVVSWTIHRPGVTAALCGAKRPEQIQETAAAMQWKPDASVLSQVEEALVARGTPVSEGAV